MTREESFEKIKKNRYQTNTNSICLQLERYAVEFEHIEELIDEIYDDFESRTCKNCKFYHPTNERDVRIDICEQKELYQYSRDEATVAPFQPPSKLFFCPYFERKSK